VQARALYGPGSTSVPTDAQSDGGRGHDQVRIYRVRAHFVHIAVNVYGGLPGSSAIR